MERLSTEEPRAVGRASDRRLETYIGVRDLNYGSVDGLNLDKVFIPVDMLLGDLYLFLNQYADAATAYYRLIKERELTVTAMYRNAWLDISRKAFRILCIHLD